MTFTFEAQPDKEVLYFDLGLGEVFLYNGVLYVKRTPSQALTLETPSKPQIFNVRTQVYRMSIKAIQ